MQSYKPSLKPKSNCASFKTTLLRRVQLRRRLLVPGRRAVHCV